MITGKDEKLDELEKEVTTKKRPFFSETRNIDEEDEKIEENEEKEQITPENFSSKLFGNDKEWTALIDSFFWYIAVCLLLVPQLIGLAINGWIIIGILLTLLWTVYGGWIKRAGEIKAKKYLKKYEKAREEKEEATSKISNLENKVKGLQDEVNTMKQRLEDGREIESKLIKNINELTTVITKNTTS